MTKPEAAAGPVLLVPDRSARPVRQLVLLFYAHRSASHGPVGQAGSADRFLDCAHLSTLAAE